MGKILKEYLLKDPWFYVLLIFSIGFLCAGFIAPPLGQIHPSVLTGIGELFAFGVLGTAVKAIDRGTPAKLEKGDISLSLGSTESLEKE